MACTFFHKIFKNNLEADYIRIRATGLRYTRAFKGKEKFIPFQPPKTDAFSRIRL